MHNQVSEVKPLSEVKNAHREYLICKRGSVYVPMKYTELHMFYVVSKVTFVKDKVGNKFTIESSLSALEGELDEKIFFRANRKVLLNIDAILEYKMVENGKIAILLRDKDFKNHVIVSQVTAPYFKKWISAL
ncbi:MAG: LytTR family DNA-binding domain-containing protein [Chitinophagaceae bacterium]